MTDRPNDYIYLTATEECQLCHKQKVMTTFTCDDCWELFELMYPSKKADKLLEMADEMAKLTTYMN